MIAIAMWRLARYVRLGMATRRPALGIAGGVFPPSSAADVTATSAPGGRDRSDPLLVRIAAVVSVAIWIMGNLLFWLALIQLPFLKNVA